MKVIGFSDYGGPEVLEEFDLPEANPGPDEVKIEVHAATVNPSDVAMRNGSRPPKLEGVQRPWVPGWELAGVIEEVGDRVHSLSEGQSVMAFVYMGKPGAYAAKVVASEDCVVAQPPGISHAAAATLPMNGLTAMRALDLLNIPRLSWLAVTGGPGALGGYLIQLAKARGLRVIADAKGDDVALVESLGVDIVVPRGDEVAAYVREALPDGVAAVADAAILREGVLPAIADRGQMASFRAGYRPRERGIGLKQVWAIDYFRNRSKLQCVRELVMSGVLEPRVAEVLPSTEAAQAHRRVERGGIRGRLVLSFKDSMGVS